MSQSDVLFRALPYFAVAVMAGGLVLRAALAAGRMTAVRRASVQAVTAYLGGRATWVCALALGAAHLAALAWPGALLRTAASPGRLIAVELTGLALGLWLLVIAVRAAVRLVRRRDGALALDLADSALIALVLLATVSALMTAILHRWAATWAAVTVAPWARSLLARQPDATLVMHLPLATRIHLVASFAALALFPFTRLGALPVVLAVRALALAARPVAAASRALAGRIDARALATRLWPEPEVRWVGAARGDRARHDDRRAGDPPTRRHLPGVAGPRSVRIFGSRT
jgi:nitrate reductase gamma subunit